MISKRFKISLPFLLDRRLRCLMFLLFTGCSPLRGKFAPAVEGMSGRAIFPGAGEAGKISKNLNRSVLTLFMPDKTVELIKIVLLSDK